MTQEQSKVMTMKKIRMATCGQDITNAMREHFKTFHNKKTPELPEVSDDYEDALLEWQLV